MRHQVSITVEVGSTRFEEIERACVDARRAAAAGGHGPNLPVLSRQVVDFDPTIPAVRTVDPDPYPLAENGSTGL